MAPRRSYVKVAEPMDQWLESQGFYRKHTAGDGSCLFRAVSEQVFYTQVHHMRVRLSCIHYIERHADQFSQFVERPLEDHLMQLYNPKEWGGQVEMSAMSLMYKRDFIIFKEAGKPPYEATANGFEEKIMLCYSHDNHYDSVYAKSFIATAGYCQSVVYEILYKNVFHMSDVTYAVDVMLHDKLGRLKKENAFSQDNLFKRAFESSLEKDRDSEEEAENSCNLKEVLAHGITPFPYKVAKALDPDIYRNIEFDIWNDIRKELKYGIYFSNNELQVGVKCLLKLDSEKLFHAHIQEMMPDKGPVVVFVEEFGEKRTVPYDNLEPLPKSQEKVQQWQFTSYKQFKHLSNIQQKSALLALEYGGKWRKSRLAKPRKMKEVLVPVPVPPRLQSAFLDNSHYAMKNSTRHYAKTPCNNVRFYRERSDNQQIQMTLQNMNSVDVNTCQTFTDLSCEDHHSPTSAMSDNSQATTCTLSSLSPSDNRFSTSETTSPMHSSANAAAALGTLEPPQVLQPSSSMTQMMTYPAYCQSSAPGPTASCTYPYMMYGSSPTFPQRDSGSYAVNLNVQRSLEPSGSDLPFSDLPTLRFFYNLGHDVFRTGYPSWAGPVSFVPVSQSAVMDGLESPPTSNSPMAQSLQNGTSNAGDSSDDRNYQMTSLTQEMQQNLVVSESNVPSNELICDSSSHVADTGENWQRNAHVHTTTKTFQNGDKGSRNGAYMPPRFQKMNFDSGQCFKPKMSPDNQLLASVEPKKPGSDSFVLSGPNNQSFALPNMHSMQEASGVQQMPMYSPVPMYPFESDGVSMMPYMSPYAVGSGPVFSPMYTSPSMQPHAPDIRSDSSYSPVPGNSSSEGPIPSPYTYYAPQSVLYQPPNHYSNAPSGWGPPHSIPIPVSSYMYPQAPNSPYGMTA